MIEIRKTKNSQSEPKYQLLVNGMLLDNARVYAQQENSSDVHYEFVISSEDSGRIFTACQFSEIPSSVEHVTLDYKLRQMDTVDRSIIHCPHKHEPFNLTFEVAVGLALWTKPYSVTQYCLEFEKVFEVTKPAGLNMRICQSEVSKISGISIENALINSTENTIADEIIRYLRLLSEIHKEVEQYLISDLHSNSIAMTFDFPAEVSVYCEQYLLYFVQFLRDLGIEATSDLKHDAGRVLFTVSPNDNKEALDNIRTALEIYLCIPSSQTNDISKFDDGIEVQRLIANIHHLKGQIAISQAILQAKEATIQAQNITIQHQQRLLSTNIIAESLVNVRVGKETEKKEELLGGTVAITKYQGKGFEVNLPEIFRRLKQRFSDHGK